VKTNVWPAVVNTTILLALWKISIFVNIRTGSVAFYERKFVKKQGSKDWISDAGVSMGADLII
jgi:hypothetical protein